MRDSFHDVRVRGVIGILPPRGILVLIGALLLSQAVCGRAARQPGGSSEVTLSGHSPADVLFVRGMISHHAQALDMVELVPDRTDNEAIHRLARRIEVSQKDEIAVMERWLMERGGIPPEGHDHEPLMPGMLTGEELSRLADATGDAFDRLFLELMIRHHEGALVMVAELFDAGGGQDPGVFQIASNVDADQRAEIARLRRMLSNSSQEDDR